MVRTSEGLTAQARTPGVPSGTSLLGLIQHLTGVQEHWFLLDGRRRRTALDLVADGLEAVP
jgi:Protein of unknown function (DUF664)